MACITCKWGCIALAALAVSVAAGCDQPQAVHYGGEQIEIPPGTLSVYQLAGRLGMEVDETNCATATLRSPFNMILVFPDPGGQMIVNGRTVLQPGMISSVGGTLFVPAEVEEQLRGLLRRPPRMQRQRTPERPDNPRRRTLGRVVLDAGHGGQDGGAKAVTGMHEKQINLAVTRMVVERLSGRGVDVVLTRDDDQFLELNDRAAISNRARADLFVSIHADWCPSPSVSGHTVYIARGAPRQTRLAGEVFDRHLTSAVSEGRGVREAGFRVLVRTSSPAVLVELGYLSNWAEARRLADDRYQARLADALADSIVEFLQAL